MAPDNKKREDQTPKNTDHEEEFIDLVDEISLDDEAGEDTGRREDELGLEEAEEEIIDLADLVEEPSEGPRTEDTGLDLSLKEGEGPSLELEAPEEEDFIDLVDEVKDEAQSEDEEFIELTDVLEEGRPEVEEEGISELSGVDFGGVDFDKDTLIEQVGLEMPEDVIDAAFAEESVGESEVSFGREETSVDAVEVPAAQGVEATLESMVDEELEPRLLEGVSDERIEAIITRLASKKIEEKADRILLKVAEAAIAKEIEKLKQAL